jgi:organic radical activating enzyme
MELNYRLNQLTLPLMEQFYTIQGEGRYSGRPAYFIRLAGCDIGCVWCDVKDSWDKMMHPLVSVQSIIDQVKEIPTDFIVITGGEPALYDLNLLIDALHSLGFEVAIETSGVYPLKGNVDWYCFSPKKFKKACDESYFRANELKVVIYHPSDFDWAEEHASKVSPECMLFLQPEWSKAESMNPILVDYIKLNPHWRLSLQTHKFLNIP